MKLNKYFETQKLLDEKIKKEKGLSGAELLFKKKLALQVEFAELANELPENFKFWSHKKNDYDKALVELVDCFHLILSIGLEFGIVQGKLVESVNYRAINAHQYLKIEQVFMEFMAIIAILNPHNYISFVCDFLALVDTLGFSWEEVEEAYFRKNQENHIRQAEGY